MFESYRQGQIRPIAGKVDKVMRGKTYPTPTKTSPGDCNFVVSKSSTIVSSDDASQNIIVEVVDRDTATEPFIGRALFPLLEAEGSESSTVGGGMGW